MKRLVCLPLVLAACQPTPPPAGRDSALAETFGGMKIEIRESLETGYLRTHPDGMATYAGPMRGSLSTLWRVENGRVCLGPPWEECFTLRKKRDRLWVATPSGGGETAEWWLMKRLDEEGNVYE